MSEMYAVDATDRKILEQLDIDGRMPVAMIAQNLNLARGTVQARLDRMQASDVFRPHSSRVKPAAFGRPVAAMVQVELDQHLIQEAIAGPREHPRGARVLRPGGRHRPAAQSRGA